MSGVYVGSVLDNGAASIASNGFSIAQQRSEEAVEKANDALDALTRNRTFYTVFASDNIGDVDTTAPVVNLPSAPEAPDLNLVLPNFPSDIAFGTVPSLNVGTAPEFTGTAPVLSFPNAPEALNLASPGEAPAVDLDITVPAAPSITLPDVPTLRELDLPENPVLDLPAFDITLPVTDLVAPGDTFSWTESPYESTKLDRLCEVLAERLEGGTGLSAEVENQIWDRGRTREGLSEFKQRAEILSNNAQTGFSRPTGSIQAALEESTRVYQNKISELNREIVIKQAELEQDNLKTTISSIISLEKILVDNHNAIQNRAFEAVKFTQQVAIDIYNAEAALFNLNLERFKAYSLAFESRLKLEIQKVEIFKAQLQAQGLINQLNETDLRIYSTTIDGLKSAVDIYRSQIAGIEAQVNVENAKLQAFKTEVEAFTAQVGAKATEFQSYGEQVKAEATKSSAFESEAKAFAARVQGYAAEVDVEKSKSDLVIRSEELKVRQQGLKLDTFARNVDAKVAAFRAQTDEFTGQARMYSAQVDAENTRLGTEIRIIDQRIEFAKAKAQIAIENARISLANIDREARLTVEIARGAADVASQLAASSLQGINYSANVGHNLSLNSNLNESHAFDG